MSDGALRHLPSRERWPGRSQYSWRPQYTPSDLLSSDHTASSAQCDLPVRHIEQIHAYVIPLFDTLRCLSDHQSHLEAAVFRARFRQGCRDGYNSRCDALLLRGKRELGGGEQSAIGRIGEVYSDPPPVAHILTETVVAGNVMDRSRKPFHRGKDAES